MPRRLTAFVPVLLLFPAAAAAQEKVTYQDHVRPIFENRCLNCHNPDKKKGDLDLSTFGGTMAGGSGGQSVEAGDSSASKLWQVITHAAEPVMPPKGDKIPQAEIDIIAKWIQGGVLDTASSTAKAKKKAGFAMGATATAGKPEGPPPMPENLLLEPVVTPARPNAVTAMAHSPWAPLVALAAPRQVLLYHSTTGDLLGVLPFPEGGNPESLSFSRNGALILAGGGVAGKKGVVAVWDVKTGKEVIKLDIEEEHDSILSADISADLSRIATGGPSRKVRIFDTATQQCLTTIKKHTDWVTLVAFSPDGVLLATGDRNGGLYVWEAGSGNEFYSLKGHEKRIAAVAWRGDSNLLAAGSEDGNFTWWEMGGGTQVKKVGSHGGVLALSFAPDGSMASGGRDGHARIWDGNGTQKRDWVPSEGNLVLETLFTEDGARVVTGAWNGDVKSWDAAKDAPPAAVLAANPPSIETRLTQLERESAEKQAGVDKTLAALKEKEAATAAVQTEIDSLRGAMAAAKAKADETAAQIEGMKTAAAKIAEERGKAVTEKEAAEKQIAALATAVPAPLPEGTPMPVEVKEAIAQVAAVSQTVDSLSKSVLEKKLEGLNATLATQDAELKELDAKLAAGQTEIAKLKSDAEAMAKAMPEKEKQLADTAKAAADLKPAADAEQAALAVVTRNRGRWLAAKENKLVLAVRTEAAELAAKLADLKEEIPALEAEIAALNAKLAAAPPPDEAETKKLQKSLAANSERLVEAKKELESLPAQAEEKQKAADLAWEKYQAMLPK